MARTSTFQVQGGFMVETVEGTQFEITLVELGCNVDRETWLELFTEYLKLAITEVGNEAASSNPTTSVDGMMQKFSAIQSTNLNSLVHSQVSVSSLGGAAGSILVQLMLHA
ncbi:hypothetical protein B0H14DRAFT_2561780 [Mycena olivaceomarginata]|nr:hypothetical protein B0H14DRAFT_2561780 [Mycena olivaceomarginata]